ncbi:MAG: galactose-1-phosphate uridylyltransferase [Elusimicrobia bacterium]|nr:galactose-1-phosphate uridylyltransferase [Elusimicrobiota bacterium]
MPELRRDPIYGRWVIIATERAKRPMEFPREDDPPANESDCPFCEGHEGKTPPEIMAYRPSGGAKDGPGWWVRVVPNKFPALQTEGDLNHRGEGVYDWMDGVGAHEVIIEGPAHTHQFHELEAAKAEDVLWSYRERILDLKKDPRMQYILIFKNHGKAAGASLSHPHAQLIALPMVPVLVKQELSGGRQYYEFCKRCLFCDLISQEINVKTRLIEENEGFVSFAPFAGRFPFECWIVPKRHESHYENSPKNILVQCSGILRSTLKRMDVVLKNAPFNYIIHSAPLREESMASFHWHIEIIPKLTQVAGFEWGTGCYINPTPPENAADYLRRAVDSGASTGHGSR